MSRKGQRCAASRAIRQSQRASGIHAVTGDELMSGFVRQTHGRAREGAGEEMRRSPGAIRNRASRYPGIRPFLSDRRNGAQPRRAQDATSQLHFRDRWMMLRALFICSFLFFVMVFIPSPTRAQWKTPWSYRRGSDGPARWASLDPAYAACQGKEQSPIDIRYARKSNLPRLRFEFKRGPLDILNNGYTAVRVNYAPGNGNFLVVGEKRYELTQFHFHHPSEEQIHGKPYAMGAHFMFRASDGTLAGVAVLLNAGRANATIQQLWRYMPKKAGKAHLIPGVEIDPEGLLPRNTAYYAYMGSLSAPPCTEGVRWFVLKAPVIISAAQISAFAKLYPHDVRPIQPLRGRVVEESR